MNEFIEKLIGRLEELRKCSDFGTCNHCQNRWCPMELLEADEVIKIANQLAEEYNDDFCEWHKVKNGNAYKCNTHAEIHDSRVLDWCVCPYCGKKIKVVE